MADYYPLLARAIDSQPNKGREVREVIYARARKALQAQLRAANPPMSEADIARQQDFLESAVRRLEADYGRDDPLPPAEPPVAAPEAAVPEAAPSLPPRRAEQPAPVAPVRAPRPRAMDDTPAEADDLWQRTERPALLDEPETDEPVVEELLPRRDRKRLILSTIFALLVLAVGLGAYLERDRLAGLLRGSSGATTTATTQTASAPAAQPAAPEAASKSADRIAQAPSTAPAPRPAASPQGVQAVPRAVLLEETAGSGQGLQQFVGTVTWSTETFQPSTGQKDVGIRADIAIPDRNFKATMTIRRNPDPNIPASHIVEIQYQLPPDFDLGNVASVPGMQAMVSEGAQGAPIRGLAVRIAPNYFLIGMLSGDAERQYNLNMLLTRPLLSVPMVFDNGRRAILVLDKGESGDNAFRSAFSAWNLTPPKPAN